MIYRQFALTILLGSLVVGLRSFLPLEFFDVATRPVAFAQRSVATSEVTTLRWLMPWNEAQTQQIALPLIAAFETQYPTIRIELQTIANRSDYERALAISLAEGAGPDVFVVSTVKAYALALQDLLWPLDGWVAADQVELAAFAPDVLAQYRTAAQGLHCLPAEIATLAVVYNQDLFDAVDVPYPQAPWTWDDLLATAQQLTGRDEADEPRYGLDRMDAYWPLLVWTTTGYSIFDDPYTPTQFRLEDKVAISALQWLADLSLVHGVMPPPAEEGADLPLVNRFLTGQAAMQLIDLQQLPTYLAQSNLRLDFVELPGGNFTANRSDGNCFAIPRSTAQVEAAWAFVKFLAGPGGKGAALLAERQPMVPALTELQRAPNWLLSALPDQHMAAFLPKTAVRLPLAEPLHPVYSRWSAVVNEELPRLWRGEEKAAEVVAAMAEEAEEIIENLQAATEMELPAVSTVTSALAMGLPVTTTHPAAHFTATIKSLAPMTATGNLAFLPPLPHHYYVAPHGDDNATGESATTAFATLQRALDLVQPGDTIHLLPGDYFENVVSRVDGRADAPITLIGATDAVLHGAGVASAAFYLTHNNYTLSGFTLDGLYGDPTQKEGYTQKLLYVQGEGIKQGVTGLRVLNMRFQNAGGECLRLRYFAQKNEIAYSTFTTCGLLDFAFAEGGKNGEAIYIGTSSTQWDDGKNPTADPDASRDNWVHHNVMNTQGNECVEIKEGASANLIEYNTCTGQLDPDSGGIGARGDGNIIRYNVLFGNIGAGVRLGGHEVDGIQYGVQNAVYGNRFLHNVAGGVNIAVGPQAKICDNWLSRNLGKASFGDASDAYQPSEPCPKE